jgi:16S rRNA (cytidine1402-2'-O)-methyltransferase
MALLTDAGTPGISDPAFLLVRACIQKDIRVECLPGLLHLFRHLLTVDCPLTVFVLKDFFPLKKGRHTLLTQLSTEKEP